MRKLSKSTSLKLVAGLGLSTLLLLWGTEAMAAEGLKDVVERLKEQIETLGPLLAIVSYVAGVGFCIAGIVQFKAHKDNPAQVPLSKPMVYLGVGAALLFLPSILSTAGQTIFGEQGQGAKSGAETIGDDL